MSGRFEKCGDQVPHGTGSLIGKRFQHWDPSCNLCTNSAANPRRDSPRPAMKLSASASTIWVVTIDVGPKLAATALARSCYSSPGYMSAIQ